MTISAWEEVGRECVAAGFQRFAGLSVKALRGDLWNRKKAEMIKRYAGSKRTGTGKYPWKPV
jgi:hypothetical protein